MSESIKSLHAQLLIAAKRVRCLKATLAAQPAGSEVQAIQEQISQGKAECLRLRERARLRRCEDALKSTHAFLKDDAVWSRIVALDAKLASVREELLVKSKAAFHDPEGAGYRVTPEDVPLEIKSPGVGAPVFSRSDLVARGIVVTEAPPVVQEQIKLLEPPPWARRLEGEDVPRPEARKRGPCGKVCYSSVADARQGHAQAGFRIRVYECHECHAWHATNSEKIR